MHHLKVHHYLLHLHLNSKHTSDMVSLTSLKEALRGQVVATSKTQLLSDAQYSEGFNVLKESGKTKYEHFIKPQLNLLLTSLSSSRTHLSVLEIGPGPASVLGDLPELVTRPIQRYVAFEPNVLFATKLEESLGIKIDAVSPLNSLDGPAIIHRLPFTPDSSTHSHDMERYDLILFCHSLYGLHPKKACIRKALAALSDGGVVVVFHGDESLQLDGLNAHHTVTFPASATVLADDDDETLNRFASFVAGFTLQDSDENAAVYAEWRRICRESCRRDEGRPDHLVFDSSEIMIQFTRYAATIPRLETLVPLAKGDIKVKNWEARLHDPASIVRPTKIKEVRECVRWAVERGVGLTIIGGGHSGHCLWPDVVAVDMSAFDQIHIHTACEYPAAKGSLVVVEAGCKSEDIIRRTMAADLTLPLGARPSVGSGLWLQGGIGHLARLHGLACDNIIGAVVVRVDSGQTLCVGCVPTDHYPSDAVRPENEDEILWALRGAGTNFGIVMSVTFTAHEAPNYTIRDWVYPLKKAFEVVDKLKDLDALAQCLPRNCSTDAYLWSDGSEMQLGVTMFEAHDTRLISDLSRSPRALIHTTLGPAQNSKTVHSMDLFDTDMYMTGIHGGHGGGKTSSFKRCILIERLDDPVLLHRLVDAFNARPSPLCYFHLLHGGGAVHDVEDVESAFGCRKWNFACVVTGIWPREQDGTYVAEATVQWVYDVVKDLEHLTLGIYGADLGPDPRDAKLATRAFGPNIARLVRLKRKMDPGNVLAYACPLLED